MSNVSIRGSATDNRGVTQVTVGIRNRVSRLWLQPNGSWGSTYQGLPASLASPGASSTGWNYQWSPQAAGTFILMIKARDAAGNMDPSPAGASFKVGSDGRAARARLVTHKPRSHQGGRGRGGVMLRGTAFDDEAVGAVMVAIKSKRTGRYWHPHHRWGRAHYFRAHMGTPGARSSNWRFHLWLRPGRYRLQLASLDATGNLHIRWIKFRVRHPR
jgi:hypothetical protein